MWSKLIDILQTYQTFKRIPCAGLNAQGLYMCTHGGISSVYNSQRAYEICKAVKTEPRIPPLHTNKDLFQGDSHFNTCAQLYKMHEHSVLFRVASFDIKSCFVFFF